MPVAHGPGDNHKVPHNSKNMKERIDKVRGNLANIQHGEIDVQHREQKAFAGVTTPHLPAYWHQQMRENKLEVQERG